MNETEWVQCDDPWRPEPPADDLRERRVWTCKIGGRVGRLPSGADWPMRKAVVAAFTELTGQPVEFCFSGWGDDLDESELAVVEDRAPDPEVIRAALAKRLEALPNPEPPALAVLPTPLPVQPWPGAVLSGLTDEDGVPTWLAQAGQVRGEQVRGWRDMAWYRPDGHTSDAWVEVRAPRAVPAALVTVTIPAETAHALLRYIEDGDYDTHYVIDRLADLLIAAMDGDQ